MFFKTVKHLIKALVLICIVSIVMALRNSKVLTINVENYTLKGEINFEYVVADFIICFIFGITIIITNKSNNSYFDSLPQEQESV
jgi:uncharacterized membrane protein